MRDLGNIDAGGATETVRLTGSPARVHCEGCEFLWYGETAAHGLSIIGHCPRCGGRLHFLEEPAGSPVLAAGPVAPDLEPAQVLGTPQTWAR